MTVTGLPVRLAYPVPGRMQKGPCRRVPGAPGGVCRSPKPARVRGQRSARRRGVIVRGRLFLSRGQVRHKESVVEVRGILQYTAGVQVEDVVRIDRTLDLDTLHTYRLE